MKLKHFEVHGLVQCWALRDQGQGHYSTCNV